MNLFPPELVAKAQEVVETNRAAGRTIALAESCTGGLVSAALTEISGSSAVFIGGFVTYANAAKTIAVEVPPALFDAHGAVSEEVARAMAEGSRQRLDTDVAVSITGIAGPGGGSDEKPVGTVWLARSMRKSSKVTVEQRHFDSTLGRDGIRLQAALAALELLLP